MSLHCNSALQEKPSYKCDLFTCLDLDTMQFGGKLVIDCKHMAILDLLGLRLLGEDSLSGFPTSQRLQCSHQLPLWDVCLLLDLLQSGEIKFRSMRS